MKPRDNDRQERLAAALRANLKRRKARDRALAGVDPAPESDPNESATVPPRDRPIKARKPD